MRRFAILAAASLALAVAACDPAPAPVATTPSPAPDASPPPPAEPFVCPAGMPSYKCQQLQDAHDPARQPPS